MHVAREQLRRAPFLEVNRISSLEPNGVAQRGGPACATGALRGSLHCRWAIFHHGRLPKEMPCISISVLYQPELKCGDAVMTPHKNQRQSTCEPSAHAYALARNQHSHPLTWSACVNSGLGVTRANLRHVQPNPTLNLNSGTHSHPAAFSTNIHHRHHDRSSHFIQIFQAQSLRL